MRNEHNGISYQHETMTERRQAVWCGVSLELVRVPPVAHSFKHHAPSHLLMFTERGTRSDGESLAEGETASTLRDTSGTFSVIPAHCRYEGWTLPTVPAEYLSVAIDPKATLFGREHGVSHVCRAPLVYAPDMPWEIKTTLAKLKCVMRAPEEHGSLYGQTLLSLLAMELFRWLHPAAVEAVPRGGLAPWQERRSKELIIAHIDGELSLDRLAAECKLSVSRCRPISGCCSAGSIVPRICCSAMPHRWPRLH
jgi:AraC family transcriptional regulator